MEIVLTVILVIVVGRTDWLSYGVSVVVGVVVGTPFVYAAAGIVLGGADAMEAVAAVGPSSPAPASSSRSW